MGLVGEVSVVVASRSHHRWEPRARTGWLRWLPLWPMSSSRAWQGSVDNCSGSGAGV